MKHLLLTIATLLFGVLTHAQWYFESSVTSNYLGSQMLENMNGGNPTPTVLDSFKGFNYTWTTITPQNSWQVTAGSFYTGSTIDLERRLR